MSAATIDYAMQVLVGTVRVIIVISIWSPTEGTASY